MRSAAAALSRPRVALLLAIVFQIGVFLVLQGDGPPDDALAYAENAHAIATDPAAFFRAPSNHPFVMRVGVTAPLALIYLVFGVNTWTTNAPCLLAWIVIVLVVYAAAPTARSKRVGLAFTASSWLVMIHLVELNADLLSGAATAVSILLLSRRDRSGSAWWIAGAVVAWFYAFLTKETAIWFAPAWLYAITVDVRAIGWRRTLRRFAPALGLGLGLAALYLAVCAWVWGDPMARAAGINALADAHIWAPQGRTSGWWLRRLTLEPPRAFIAAFGAPLVIALVGWRQITGANRVWVVATASALLMLWFGSASTDQYVPLPLEPPRMLTAAIAGVLVLAALASDTLRWRWPWLWIPIVVIATVLPPARYVALRWVPARIETVMHRMFRHEIADIGGNVLLVCTNHRCLQAIRFYYDFHPPPNLRAAYITDFASAPPPAGERVYIVVEPFRTTVSDVHGAPIIDSVDALRLRPILFRGTFRLYDAGDGGQLHATVRSRLPG